MNLTDLLPSTGPLAEARAETFAVLAAEATETAEDREEIRNQDAGDLAQLAYELLRDRMEETTAEAVDVGDPDSDLVNYFVGTLAIHLQVVALARDAEEDTQDALCEHARSLRQRLNDAQLGAIWLQAIDGAESAGDVVEFLEAAESEAPSQG